MVVAMPGRKALAIVLLIGCNGTPASVPTTQPSTTATAADTAAEEVAVKTERPFVSMYGDRLGQVEVIDRQLSDRWPAGVYKVQRLRATKPGAFGLSYTYTRTREGGAQAEVTRHFGIHVLSAGAQRNVVVSHPYHVPGRVGDIFEIPLPTSDPWGAMSDLKWNPVSDSPLFGAFEPTGEACDATTAKRGERFAPQLKLVRTACQRIMMRSTQERVVPWGYLRAVEAGPVAGTRLVVGDHDVLTIPAYVRHEIDNNSSATVVDDKTVVPLTLDDHLWLKLGE